MRRRGSVAIGVVVILAIWAGWRGMRTRIPPPGSASSMTELGETRRPEDSGRGSEQSEPLRGATAFPAAQGTKGSHPAGPVARVRGTVLDAAGSDVIDAQVHAIFATWSGGGPSVRSRRGGTFEFDALSPGPWRIAASDALGHVGVTTVTLAEGDNDGVVVRFVGGDEIRGVVLFEGKPVAGAVVELNRCHAADPALIAALAARDAAFEHLGRTPFSDGRGFRREAETSASGTFLFREIEDATCSLEATKADIGRSLRRPGVRPGEKGIVLALERGGDLRGRLIDSDGSPFEPEGMVVANGVRDGANVFQTFCEIDHGHYEFRSLPAGHYVLSAPLFARAGPVPFGIDLAVGEKKLADIHVPWSATVRGRVVDANDANPIDGASVDLQTIHTPEREIDWFAPLGSTESDGRFEIAHVSDAMTIEIHAAGYSPITLGLPVADGATLDLHDVRLTQIP